jgi:hypothetical protein
MANIVYNAGLTQLWKSSGAFETNTYKAALERSTSTYTPNKDHADLATILANGFVEISVPSYSRQTLTNKTVNTDNANDRSFLDCDDINFGVLESGQTVKAILIYRDGANDSQRIPLAYIDQDEGGLLPRALADGQFTVRINVQGLLDSKQV